jgi:glutathione synthase/RimK-type ligase-like ATP-grasp enzyme
VTSVAILTPDPAEHSWKDLQGEIFRRMAEPLAAAGVMVEGLPWTTASAEALSRFAVVLPLLAWGYHFDLARFRSQLEGWSARGVRLRNPAPVLSWNADKRYLDDLARAGARTVPTLFVDRLEADDVARAAGRFGVETVVVKPQVSGAAWKTVRLRPGDPLDAAPNAPAMIQPFLPAIGEEGELSLFYFDRRFSHAVRKRPRAGDFRVQEQFGGEAEPCAPDADALATAETVLAAVEGALLYARVDLLRGLDGHWALNEIELIEPDLFLAYDRLAAERFALAVRGAAETAVCC